MTSTGLLQNTSDILKLHDGDCFLCEPDPNVVRQEVERLDEYCDMLEAFGSSRMSSAARKQHLRQYLEPHIVLAVSVKTGVRVSTRVKDGKHFVWDSGEVEWVDKQEHFEARLVDMARERKKFEDDLNKGRSRSKKKGHEEELLAAA